MAPTEVNGDRQSQTGFGVNMAKSGITTVTLALLAGGLTTLISFGQEASPAEAPPTAQPAPLGPGDHTQTQPNQRLSVPATTPKRS